jgi:hypothetical protein
MDGTMYTQDVSDPVRLSDTSLGLMEDDLQAVIAQGDLIFGVSVGKVD